MTLETHVPHDHEEDHHQQDGEGAPQAPVAEVVATPPRRFTRRRVIGLGLLGVGVTAATLGVAVPSSSHAAPKPPVASGKALPGHQGGGILTSPSHPAPTHHATATTNPSPSDTYAAFTPNASSFHCESVTVTQGNTTTSYTATPNIALPHNVDPSRFVTAVDVIGDNKSDTTWVAQGIRATVPNVELGTDNLSPATALATVEVLYYPNVVPKVPTSGFEQGSAADFSIVNVNHGTAPDNPVVTPCGNMAVSWIMPGHTG